MFAGRSSGLSATVSVTTISVEVGLRELLEGVADEVAVRGEHVDLFRPGLLQRLGAGEQRPAGEDHVVAHQRDLPGDVADDLGDRRLIVRRPRLVHDRQVGVEHLAEAPSELRPPRIRRDRDDVFAGQALVPEVLREERQRGHVVDRDREKALDLAGMQIHRQHAVDACRLLERVGQKLGRDRLARSGLLVLPGIWEPRHHGGDPLRRGELGCVDHHEELHDVRVHLPTPAHDWTMNRSAPRIDSSYLQ